MNEIEKLIAELCPNGVEWRELGEVCSVNKGKQLNKKLLTEDGFYPAYNGGKNYSGRTNNYNVEANTIIVSQGGASAGFVNFVETKFWANAHCYYLIPDETQITNRFLYHFVKMNQSYLMDFQYGAGIPALKSDKLTKMLLPIPPLKIQKKIVQILDKFTDYVTELTSELTSELTLRQKQYSFYRDKLLSFEDEVYQVEWKAFGEVAKLKNGKDWKELGRGTVPVYGSGGEMGEFVDQFSYDKPTVLIPRKGSISNLFYLDKPFWNVDTIYYTKIDREQIIPKYLYYFMKTLDLKNMATNPTRPSLTQSIIDKIKLPVPSLEIQTRIVQVLDNFDTVCNDLNIGLPKEIELRQKQYEYFRDKLLTFTAEGVYTDSTVQYRQDIIRLLQWVFGPIRVKLSAVINLSRGKRLTRSQLSENNGYPVYQNSLKPLGYYQEFNRSADTTFVICAGAAGEIAYSNLDFWAADDVFTLDVTKFISSRFMYYTLLNIQESIKGKVRKASIPRLSKGALENIIFILPPITKQKSIVSILDKFDILINDLSQGLPKEIGLRQKQYEYFRDKLLKFK
jgi:restriction endonuclease S subunit